MARRRSAFVVLLCAALLAVLLPATTAVASGTSQLAALDSNVLRQLNEIRLRNGLVPLVLSTQLDEAATAHTDDMIAHGYFAHTSSDGSPFWKRIQRYYASSDDSYWAVGENLLWGSERLDASTSVAAWMASAPHRANILFPAGGRSGLPRFAPPTPRAPTGA